jgi:hypothetical protein
MHKFCPKSEQQIRKGGIKMATRIDYYDLLLGKIQMEENTKLDKNETRKEVKNLLNEYKFPFIESEFNTAFTNIMMDVNILIPFGRA